MKKTSLYHLCVLLAIVVCTTTLFIACKTKAAENPVINNTADELAIPAIYERKGELAKATEWLKTKEKVAELNRKIAKQSNDIKSRLQIAVIYMSEARVTGEHPYYYPAILKILDGVLTLDRKNFEAMVYKASVKMSQHHFAEAKAIAENARAINPENAYVYGVLVDANVELGNYEEAVKVSDKMQSLKPSLESYSRASYLREIYGDMPGSIAAMKMAVQAGIPGSEPWCWSKKTLGLLYEKTGKSDLAQQEFQDILATRPSYAFAIEGLASIQKGKKDYAGALQLLDQASAILPEFSFAEEKGDIYILSGEKEKARTEYDKVIGMLQEDQRSGHTTALEMCRIYTKTGQFDLAIEQGLKEYSIRPFNIDVNQSLAWAYFNNKEQEKAQKHIELAGRTGSKDPELAKRTALIKNLGSK